MLLTENLVAATPKRFNVAGNFFLLDDVPAGSVDIDFFLDNRKLDEELRAAVEGWYVIPPQGFDRFTITSTLTQAVRFHVCRGRVGANILSGLVTVDNLRANALALPGNVTVGAAEVAVLAAAELRKLIIFRAAADNTDSIALGPTGLTTALASIVLEPGDIWREEVAASAAWYARATAAGQILRVMTGS